MERLPYKEIAKILNISVKTINIHIAKALEIISEGLRK
jgi:DNA-directed RNA polymerase specialized sigma24 family protein